MHKKQSSEVFIPADVPEKQVDSFITNYSAITRNTEHLLLFSVDQKIEHLNYSFYGSHISPDDNNPEHLFNIASKGYVGAMATQLGLIARYGKQFKNINYIVKLNSKTGLIPTDYSDPLSKQLWTVEQVVQFKNSTNLPICGVGYTVYLGSQFEAEMLTQAAQAVYEAHQNGLVAILWMYPRGECVENELDGELIAGAAGIANTLGSDFAKINTPEKTKEKTSEQWLVVAQEAAGNTKIITSGGKAVDEKKLVQRMYKQIHDGTTAGGAIGRNIHQKSLAQAIALTKALSAIVYENKNVKEATKLLS